MCIQMVNMNNSITSCQLRNLYWTFILILTVRLCVRVVFLGPVQSIPLQSKSRSRGGRLFIICRSSTLLFFYYLAMFVTVFHLFLSFPYLPFPLCACMCVCACGFVCVCLCLGVHIYVCFDLNVCLSPILNYDWTLTEIWNSPLRPLIPYWWKVLVTQSKGLVVNYRIGCIHMASSEIFSITGFYLL